MSESSSQHSKFAAIFAAGTFLSRITGLVRDIVLFGLIPRSFVSPFIVAWRFPNMLRDLVGEGASNAAFVPVFSASRAKDTEQEYRELMSAVMSAMILLLGVITIIGVLCVPWLLHGSNVLDRMTGRESLPPEQTARAVFFSQWIFPYIFFIGLTVFQMGALFSKRHYSTPSWSPMLLNIAMIGSCFAAVRWFTDASYALIVGVWLGGIAQLVVNYIAMGRHVGVWRPNFKLNHPAIKTVFWLLVPVLIGQATNEVNKLVDNLFAFRLGEQAVTALYAANRVIQLPQSMFALSVAAAILPTLSRSAAQGNYEEIRSTMIHGFRQCFFLVFPAMIGIIVLRAPIIRLLFERGEWIPSDTEATATALAIYGAGLLFFGWVKIAVSGFYAVQDTKTPVIVASASMLLNILLNFALVRPLGFAGLAWATTISFSVNFILLYVLLCNRFGPLWDGPSLSALFRMILATGVMAAVIYGLAVKLDQITWNVSIIGKFVEAGVPIAIGAAIYLVLCAAFGLPELKSLLNILTRRR